MNVPETRSHKPCTRTRYRPGVVVVSGAEVDVVVAVVVISNKQHTQTNRSKTNHATKVFVATYFKSTYRQVEPFKSAEIFSFGTNTRIQRDKRRRAQELSAAKCIIVKRDSPVKRDC